MSSSEGGSDISAASSGLVQNENHWRSTWRTLLLNNNVVQSGVWGGCRCNRSSYSKINHGNTNLIRLWPTQCCIRSVSTFRTEICSFFTERRGKLKLQAVVIQKHSSHLNFASFGIVPYLGSYIWLLIYNIKETQDSVRAYLKVRWL